MQPGKPMGKTAALAADLLRGLKTDYTPHVDCGDFVVIINAEQAVLTGKLEQVLTARTPATPAACTRRSTRSS